MRQIYIGIDIAKNLHYDSIVDSHRDVLEKVFSFENNIEGFEILLSKIQNYDLEDCIFRMESTAHYSNNLSNYLLTPHYNIIIINNLQIFLLHKTQMRDAKNDKIDSFIICQALIMQLGNKVILEDTTIQLQDICKSYQSIMTMRSRTKIQLVTYLDQSFPELAKYFKKSVHGKAIYYFLKKYSLPSKINKVRIDKLTNIVSLNSHGKYKKEKAMKLKELYLNTGGI